MYVVGAGSDVGGKDQILAGWLSCTVEVNCKSNSAQVAIKWSRSLLPGRSGKLSLPVVSPTTLPCSTG